MEDNQNQPFKLPIEQPPVPIQAPVFGVSEGNKKGKIWAMTIIILIILFAGGGAGAYFYFFSEPQPAEVMKNMSVAVAQIKSAEIDVELKGEIKTQGDVPIFNAGLGEVSGESVPLIENGAVSKTDQFIPFVANVNAGFDNYDAQNKKSYSVMSIKAGEKEKAITIGVESRKIGDVIYNSLTSFSMPNAGMFDFLIGVVKNKWLRVDYNEIIKMLPQDIGKEATAMIEKKKADENANQETLDKVVKLFWQADLIKIISVLPSQKLENQPVFHYLWKINTANIKNFAQQVCKEINNRDLTVEELAKLDQAIAKIEETQNSTDANAEIWIGKKDFLPRKIQLEYFKFSPAPKEKESFGVNAVFFDISVIFKNYNKPLAVTAPEQSQSIPEFMGSLFGRADMFGNLQKDNSATDSLTTAPPAVSKDTDNDGLTDNEEAVYGTNPLKKDTDGDGYLDGAEVKNGFNPNGSGNLIKK